VCVTKPFVTADWWHKTLDLIERMASEVPCYEMRFDPQLHLRFDGDARRNQGIRQERLTPEEIVGLERADDTRFAALCYGEDKLINPEFNHIGCDHLFHCGAGNSSFNLG